MLLKIIFMFSYFLSNPLAVLLPRSPVWAHLLQQRLYAVQCVLDVLVQLWVAGHLQQTQGRVRAMFDMSQDNAKRGRFKQKHQCVQGIQVMLQIVLKNAELSIQTSNSFREGLISWGRSLHLHSCCISGMYIHNSILGIAYFNHLYFIGNMLSCSLTAQSWGSLLLLLSVTCLFHEHLLYPQLWDCSLLWQERSSPQK